MRRATLSVVAFLLLIWTLPVFAQSQPQSPWTLYLNQRLPLNSMDKDSLLLYAEAMDTATVRMCGSHFASARDSDGDSLTVFTFSADTTSSLNDQIVFVTSSLLRVRVEDTVPSPVTMFFVTQKQEPQILFVMTQAEYDISASCLPAPVEKREEPFVGSRTRS